MSDPSHPNGLPRPEDVSRPDDVSDPNGLPCSEDVSHSYDVSRSDDAAHPNDLPRPGGASRSDNPFGAEATARSADALFPDDSVRPSSRPSARPEDADRSDPVLHPDRASRSEEPSRPDDPSDPRGSSRPRGRSHPADLPFRPHSFFRLRGRPRPWEFFRTLTGRAVLVTAATAVVAVIVTALVAVPVAVRSVNNQTRAQLMDKAVLATELLTDERPAARARIATRLRADDIEIYLIRNGRPDRAGLPPRVVRRVAAGKTVTQRAQVGGRPSFVAGRPLPGASSGVVLARRVASGTAVRVLGGVWGALLAGLIGGILAGALLARLVARPIWLASDAAARLAAGDRRVRLPDDGPIESVRLAFAFNHLASALQTSEGRQREFLLSVSHELRTPLATIRGYAEALADGVITGADVTSAGSTVLGEAERLDRLISDLLVLSRLEAADLPLDMTRVNLVDLIEEAGRVWATRCGTDGPALSVQTPPDPVDVHTDPGRIRQVVDNLCENALRVLPPGTPLIMAVRADDTNGIIEIRDGGPGFTDDDLSVAFDRGELNRRYRGVRNVGSGLGLALAARLVTRLGGRIKASHAPEGGAMFTVHLPRHP